MHKISLALILAAGCSIGPADIQLSMADEPPVVLEADVITEMPYKNRLCGEDALLAMERNFFAIQCGNYMLIQRQQDSLCSVELWYDSPNDNYTDVMKDTNCDGVADEFLLTDANGENMHHANPDIVRYEFVARTADMSQSEARVHWLEWRRRQQ